MCVCRARSPCRALLKQVGRELFVAKRARVAIRADFDAGAAFGARARFDFIVAQVCGTS